MERSERQKEEYVRQYVVMSMTLKKREVVERRGWYDWKGHLKRQDALQPS